jgi:hypothetical protein
MNPTTTSKIEVADVFLAHAHLLDGISTQCHKVIRAITQCRTERLGKHSRQCDQCDFAEISYNSCRNRHCPKCQFLSQTKWVDQRVNELLPCPYFHVVFTLPASLNPLILRNKKETYDVLFKASSETLKEVAANKKNMGASLGFIGVLHTWGQNLMDHPHIHYIVPGGGLSEDKKQWIKCKSKYLLSVKILSIVFQGKFLSALEKLYDEGELKLEGQISHLQDRRQFKALLVETTKKPWVVYTKKPFAGAEQVVSYLGRYTHRIAISNHRLIKMENGKVHFRYRDYRDENKKKVMALDAFEFMRRFLLHVLPHGFVKIRHFGILASRCKKTNLEICRRILNVLTTVVKLAEKETWVALLKRVKGIDLELCPKCKTGRVQLGFAAANTS